MVKITFEEYPNIKRLIEHISNIPEVNKANESLRKVLNRNQLKANF